MQLVYDALSFQIAMQYEMADAMVDEMNELITKTMAAFDNKIKSSEKRIEKVEYCESESYEAYVLGEMIKQELSMCRRKKQRKLKTSEGR